MTVTDFLLPVFVLVGLAIVLLFMMASERVTSIRSGDVRVEDIALRQPNWTRRGTQYANAFHNQLELPMLFYVLIAFILITRAGDLLLLVLAWIFVLLRIAHAYVHTTSNRVDLRFRIFAASVAALVAMWAIFAFRIVTGA